MTLKRTNPLDILLGQSNSMMFYGEPKVGKTLLAGSFPHQVLIAVPASEATTLAQNPTTANTTVLGCTEWPDVKEAVDMAVGKKRVEGEYETISLDNLTFAYRMAFTYVIETLQRTPTVNKSSWTNINREMSNILDKLLLTGHGKNVILVAHSRNLYDEDGKLVKVHPDFGENFSRAIAGRVNSVFHLRMKGKDRELVTRAVGGIVAGSRLNVEGTLINPTAEAVTALIENYKEQVAKQHGREYVRG